MKINPVIPAKAGIQVVNLIIKNILRPGSRVKPGTTAFAGMTKFLEKSMFLGITFFLLGVLNLCAQPQPGNFYTSGPIDTNKIALTFDDGPGPYTEKFLDLLDQYKVKATFFMSGEQVKYRPHIAKMVADRGHEIADHTYSHINYGRYANHHGIEQSRIDLTNDMKKSRELIEEKSGKKVRLCRMPNGIDRPWIKEVAAEQGVSLVNWTYGADWVKEDFEKTANGYKKAVKPGAILLFHDGGSQREKSLKLTEVALKEALEKDLKVVTVGQLLNFYK